MALEFVQLFVLELYKYTLMVVSLLENWKTMI